MPVPKKLTVLYVVSINASTSVPLEAAGKIAELSGQHNISFYAAAYYKQPNTRLATSFVKNLIELGFTRSYRFSTIRHYYRLIKKIQPDILHVHHGVSAFQGAVLAKLAGVKYVVKTEHNDHRFYKWYQKILTVPVFLLTQKIICNSQSTQSSFYPWEKLIAGRKSTYVYNGIDVYDIAQTEEQEACETMRRRYQIAATDLLFVSVGRLIEQKNYKRLIAAVAKVCRRAANVKLIIVGGGSGQGQLQKQIEESGMQQHIFLTGLVPRCEVYRFVHAADFFIIPSLWEGFCNSLVEAMAAGKPVITSDIQTLREVAGNTAAAFFHPKSEDSMVNAIQKAIDMPPHVRTQHARAAKERAFGKFTLQATAENYIREYQQISSTHGQ